MNVTAVATDDEGSLGTAPLFVESVVSRLHTEYRVDRDRIRHLAAEVLDTFANARVQTFVPLLVEKRLREICRALRDGGDPPAPATAVDGSGRHWLS